MNRPKHGGNLAWAARIANCSPSEILDFSASINPLGPPASAVDAIYDGLAALHAYPDPTYRPLREALARIHGLEAEWILLGNGAAELLTWAGRDLASLDATYLPVPAFGDYWRSLQAFSARVLPHCLLADGETSLASPFPDLEPATAACRGLLLNNPHNPTGYLWQVADLHPCLPSFGLVVADEAFMDFLPPERQPSLIPFIGRYPNLAILRSLTKFYSLPGLRLGYAIAHPDRLGRWQEWRDPWPVNVLAVAAGMAAIADLPFQEKTWKWLNRAAPRFLRGWQQLPGFLPFPGAANFLLVRSPISVSCLQEYLLRHHRLSIRDCLSFPELGNRYLRAAVRMEAENQCLLSAIEEALQSPHFSCRFSFSHDRVG